MTCYLTITIDVEPDSSYKSWRYSSPITFTGVEIGIRDILHPLFNKYGYKPTYLLNNVVIEDDNSVKILQELGGEYELGTHLHSEFIHPEKKIFDYSGAMPNGNQCLYKPEIEYLKIKNITELFETNFGYRPKSFRAGRYNARANTIRSLIDLGYKVDTSVTPHMKWNDDSYDYKVDYSSALEQPYFPDIENWMMDSGSGTLLEIPISIIESGFFRKNRIWLRPYLFNVNKVISVIEQYKKKYCTNTYIVYNMMFHNVEVMSGLNPYVSDDGERDLFIKQLDEILSYCANHAIQPATASDIYELFTRVKLK